MTIGDNESGIGFNKSTTSEYLKGNIAELMMTNSIWSSNDMDPMTAYATWDYNTSPAVQATAGRRSPDNPRTGSRQVEQ